MYNTNLKVSIKHRIYQRLVTLLGSRRLWYGILGLFVVEAMWVMVSGRYPMAFDEDYHFGIIKLYAQQWSPFFAHQPVGANVFGAIVRYLSTSTTIWVASCTA